MGTRNLTMVHLDNAYRVAQYGQWDGYPSCTGAKILEFLTKHNIETFKEKVKNTEYITNEMNEEFWKEIGVDVNVQRFVDMEQAEKFYEKHPTLSRDLGCEILDYIYKSEDKVWLRDSSDFIKDAIMCEWVYVVDLDSNKFEVYEGFNKTELDESDRFYLDGFKEDDYYPVKLLKSYDLNNLPTETAFLDELGSY